MSTKYAIHGDIILLTSDKNIAAPPLDALPAGTYTVGFSMDHGYYLKVIDDLEPLPSKIYGSSPRHAQRIIDTFSDRPRSTGVLLSGQKGTGKTLLATETAVRLKDEQGIPTIVINHPHHGEDFNTFMQSIQQPVVIMFDEFEKVYHEREWQQRLLTLFDGVYTGKKLFIITVNERHKLDSHLINRPGRIFYALDYTGLDAEFIREYTIDNLIRQDRVDSVCNVAFAFGDEFSFDMLKALIEEMNRYDEPVQDAITLLNADPSKISASYDVALLFNGKYIGTESFNGNVMFTDNIEFEPYSRRMARDEKVDGPTFERMFGVPKHVAAGSYREAAEWFGADDALIAAYQDYSNNREYLQINFDPTMIVSTDTQTGTIVMRNEDGYEAHLNRPKARTYSYYGAY